MNGGINRGRGLLASDFDWDPQWVEDFWDRGAEQRNGCLVWTGAMVKAHGVVVCDDTNFMVRRVSYALTHGECPAGKTVGATCLNPSCFNPKHLYVGSISKILTARTVWRGQLTEAEVRRIRRIWDKRKVTEIVALFPGRENAVMAAGNNDTHFDPDYKPVTHTRCDLSPHAKLSSKRVARARRRRAAGWTIARCAESEGVAFSTMSDALHGVTWKCVHDVKPLIPARANVS